MKFNFCEKIRHFVLFIIILATSPHLKAYSYFTLQNSFGQSNLVESNSSKAVPPVPVVWETTQLSVHLDFDTADAPWLIEGGWNFKAQLALLQWNDVAEKLTWSVASPVQGLQACNGLPISYITISAQWGRDFCGTPWGEDVLALTQITYQINESSQGRTAEIIAANLIVNNTNPWSVYQGPLRYLPNGKAEHDFQRVVLHELGHAAGLTHPDENSQVVAALMNSTEGDLDAPTMDDIDGINALYPSAEINSVSIPESKGGGGVLDQNFLIALFILLYRRCSNKHLT